LTSCTPRPSCLPWAYYFPTGLNSPSVHFQGLDLHQLLTFHSLTVVFLPQFSLIKLPFGLPFGPRLDLFFLTTSTTTVIPSLCVHSICFADLCLSGYPRQAPVRDRCRRSPTMVSSPMKQTSALSGWTLGAKRSTNSWISMDWIGLD